MKRLLFFVIDCWRVVMDNRYNPLRHIHDPSIQLYFTIALFIMWSGYFGVVAAYYMSWLGYSIVTSIWVHMAVVIPIAVTNHIFREAEQRGGNWVTEFRTEQEQEKFKKKLSRSNYEKRIKWDIDREA
jgi:hypothetical protein|tara:strand:- start:764 stop:1147 length:384 start_codon:yes stop_codon:yes gene_type:complete